MATIEETIEIRGISRKYLEEYFIRLGGRSDGQGKFSGPDWEVELGEERSCSLGSLQFPSTRVFFHAEEALCRELVAAFRQEFLRAGG